MVKYYDVIKGVKNALSKFSDRQILFLSLLYLVVLALGQIPNVFEDVFVDNMNLGIVAGWGIIYLIASLIGFFYVMPRLYARAMELNSVPVAKIPGAIDWLILHIRLEIVNIFCWYDKKLLIPGVALFAVGIAFLFVNPVAAYILVLIGLLALAIGVYVHSIRTGYAPYAFIRGDGIEAQMPRASFGVIKGQTFQVFLAQTLIGLIVGVPFAILILLLMFDFAMVGLELIAMLGIFVLYVPLLAIGQIFMADMFRFYFDGKNGEAKHPSEPKPAIMSHQTETKQTALSQSAKKAPAKKSSLKKRKK